MSIPIQLQEPEPCGWNRTEVQRFASKAAQSLGFKPGDNIETVVSKLGGTICTSDWASARNTGSITVKGRNEFHIALSPLSGERRSRFTIAHEIGHYILHSQMGKKQISVKRDGCGRVEWEANWFAAGFLMPEAEFQAKVQEGLGSAELAEYFGVSEEAVQIRRNSL